MITIRNQEELCRGLAVYWTPSHCVFLLRWFMDSWHSSDYSAWLLSTLISPCVKHYDVEVNKPVQPSRSLPPSTWVPWGWCLAPLSGSSHAWPYCHSLPVPGTISPQMAHMPTTLELGQAVARRAELSPVSHMVDKNKDMRLIGCFPGYVLAQDCTHKQKWYFLLFCFAFFKKIFFLIN